MLLRYCAAFVFTGVLSAQTTPPGFPTADDAAKLEAALESKPDDLSTRSRLLSIYRARDPKGKDRARHTVWFVEHRPEDALLRWDEPIEGENYPVVAEAWKKLFTGEPPRADVYGNAIRFFAVPEPDYAGKLAAEGRSRYPNDAGLANSVGRLYGFLILGAKGMDRFGLVSVFDDALAKSEAADLARRELETTTKVDLLVGAGDAISMAFAQLRLRGREAEAWEMSGLSIHYLERAVKLDSGHDRATAILRRTYQSVAAMHRDPAKKVELLEKAVAAPGDNAGRWHVLADLAKAQFDTHAYGKAAENATELLASAAIDTKDWYYPDATHWGNIVLGRIALKDGKVEEAAKRLVAAGATKGSPVLGSFGPDWNLARELASKGEMAPVLEYIAECRTFWKMGGKALDYWEKSIRDGAVPSFTRADAATGGRGTSAEVAKLVGKAAPEFDLKDLSGKTVRLADFRGKVVLLDFWAVWCGPCRKEMPTFEKLHREFDGKDVAIVTIDADEPRTTPAQYMKDEKLTFPVLIAEGTKVVDQYGVVAFPTAVVIDAEGKVAAFGVGGRSEAEIRELIAKARK